MPRPLPDFGFLHAHANEDREQRGQAADEEHWSPPPPWKNEEVADRGEQITGRVTFLQQARQDSADSLWRFLHRQRSANAPLSSHPDPEQRAQNEEGHVIRSEA